MPNHPDTDRSPSGSKQVGPELWERAFEALKSSAPGIRPLIGRVLKDHGSETLREFIEALELNYPDDPVKYLFGFMRAQTAYAANVARDERGQFRSIRYVLERQIFADAPQLVLRFKSAVVEPALALNLKGNHPPVLAYHLGRLYLKIVAEPKDASEAMDLLSKYVDWLLQKDWECATLNILRHDSGAFSKFRTETDPTYENPDDAA